MSNPISSLHISTRPDWRGGENQVLLTLRGLRDRGHMAELLALDGGALETRARHESFTVHQIARHAVRWSCMRQLRRLLRRKRWDIVHAHDPHGLTAAWLAGAHRRSALVAQRRVANPLSGSAIGLGRYRAACKIFAVSEFVAKSVADSGIAASQVEVNYEGVEMPQPPTADARAAARARWKIRNDEILLGCVGYLLPEKGQEALVRALPAIRRDFPSCRLILAGDGPCRSALEALARELNVADAVIFGGFVEDIAEVYRALDVFQFPSVAEPLGTSMLAAMSHGLPVVGVASGGVPEMVEHERNGLLARAADAAEFSAATLRLLRSPELARQFGAAARETIAAKFTADRMVEGTLEKYRRILGESARS